VAARGARTGAGVARGARKGGAGRRPRRAGLERPRLVRTLVSTVLLVLTGFAVGLLAGALWEKPGTLLGPFRGDAQLVDLSPLAEPGGDTRAPAGEDPGPVERPLHKAGAGASDLGPVAAPPPPATEGPFVVQVGSFDEPVPAWKLAEQLGEKEYAVYVDEGEAAGKPRWRVRVGPVSDYDQADRLARRLKTQERLPTWIVTDAGRG